MNARTTFTKMLHVDTTNREKTNNLKMLEIHKSELISNEDKVHISFFYNCEVYFKIFMSKILMVKKI